jgi:hypothetical protein
VKESMELTSDYVSSLCATVQEIKAVPLEVYTSQVGVTVAGSIGRRHPAMAVCMLQQLPATPS